MNTSDCQEVQALLDAYLDSELDARTSLEIGRHLTACPACAARLAAEMAWDRELKARLTATPTAEGLWGPIEERVRDASLLAPSELATSEGKVGSRSPTDRGWRYWLWPSPRLYAALATAWVIILAVQLGLREPARPGGRAGRKITTALVEQRHLLAELLGTIVAEPNPTGNPPPQSDARRPAGGLFRGADGHVRGCGWSSPSWAGPGSRSEAPRTWPSAPQEGTPASAPVRDLLT